MIKDFRKQFRNMNKVRMLMFIVIGGIAMQFVPLFNHGTFYVPTENPAPLVVGMTLGLFTAIIDYWRNDVTTVLQDELEAKEALLNSLRISEERLLLATKDSFIWDWDVETDELYMSPGFAAKLGYTDAEFEGIKAGSLTNILHQDDVLMYLTKLNAHLKNPCTPFTSQHRFRTKSGEYRWFLGMGYSIVDENGKATRFNGISTDVTERVDLEAQLLEAQKRETIGTLTGGVAHDFNNLLTIIIGNLELLEDTITTADQKNLVENAMDASLRGADLTQSMLSFARKAQLDPKVVDLNALVDNLSSWIERTIPSFITVKTQMADDLWAINVDPNSAENGLLNLILNARDAMKDGGVLSITTRNLVLDEPIVPQKHDDIKPGQYVLLTITDTGHGIKREDLPSIFQPFYTTKSVGEGSGLGLSMLDGFMRQSGGVVQVESTHGEGTTFGLYFPAVQQPAFQDVASSQSYFPPTKQNDHIRILLVDDNVQALSAIRAILSKLNYDVIVAESGDEAYEVYLEHPKIDILVTDIVMPGTLQGTDLAQKLRQVQPDLKVIFMSGYAPDETDPMEGNHANDVRLMKPIQRKVLVEAIGNLLTTAADFG